LLGSSASRNNICATIIFAETSVTSSPRKMILSFKSRE